MQTALKVVNNKNTAIELLIRQEEKAVAEAIAAGYKDPRLDSKLSKTLKWDENGVEYRRFIKEFKHVSYSQKNPNSQTRQKDVDRKYCKEELLPDFEKKGMEYPPMGVTKGSYVEVDAGFHRFETHYMWKPAENIPFLEITEETYHYDNQTWVVSSNSNYHRVRSAANSNKKLTIQKPLKEEDAAYELRRAFAGDPTFNGLNPTGKEFDKSTRPKKGGATPFEKVMDSFFPNEFQAPTNRGRILNSFHRRPKAIREIDDLIIDHCFDTILKWGNQKNQKKSAGNSRKQLLESCSLDKKSYVCKTDSNGKNFVSKVVSPVMDRMFSNDSFSKNNIKLVCEIYEKSLNGTYENLQNERNNFIDVAIKQNERFLRMRDFYDPNKRAPIIDEIYFPQQLLSNVEDKGELWKWCSHKREFIETAVP